ncbi:NAD-dependent epimerase/dehydratase family protein [Sphaerisporangium album]|uniref:NAD-dependent epimerase/dehydratase family protein n=2 Tax=Sphaerisporangium album TaxID=509200 RepID=A0A367FK86_9ACTN|nr:NAD-dependent epimerase/dehydratase family protein [Sphaerisporangium album]RCG30661.1 NAD-dependent epimerase/dehydratase family protein [Sphaerisporangium album]
MVITGGAGFLGSHLSRRFVRAGARVVCLDSLVTGSAANVRDLLGDPRFELVVADVTEPWSVPGPVDAVLHLASPASPRDYARLPLETLRAGSAGTWNALTLAREKGARFLLASTSEVYGEPSEHPQRESYFGNVNPVGPRSMYDEAKRFAEALTTSFSRVHGVRCGIVRLFNVYGPHMSLSDGRVVPAFIGQALSGLPLTVFGDGGQTRSLCYVDDAVEGMVASCVHDTGGRPVNIGSDEEVSVLDLAALILRLTAGEDDTGPSGGRPPGRTRDPDASHGLGDQVRHLPLPPEDPRRRRPDLTLARELLNWKPQTALRDGLARTIQWARDAR